MIFSEMIKLLKTGNRSRKTSWKPGLYIELVSDTIRFRDNGGIYTISHKDILDMNNDWEVYIKTKTLSDKMKISVDEGIFYEEDVKKFIESLKSELKVAFCLNPDVEYCDKCAICKEVDVILKRRAGDKLA